MILGLTLSSPYKRFTIGEDNGGYHVRMYDLTKSAVGEEVMVVYMRKKDEYTIITSATSRSHHDIKDFFLSCTLMFFNYKELRKSYIKTPKNRRIQEGRFGPWYYLWDNDSCK